jgi:hypothetical protein
VVAIFMRFNHFGCRRLAKLFYSSRTYYYITLLQYKTYRTVMYTHNTVRYHIIHSILYGMIPYRTTVQHGTVQNGVKWEYGLRHTTSAYAQNTRFVITNSPHKNQK